MMASLELPHWLMIAGALLVVAGFVGVLVSGNKADEVNPPPDEPTDAPRQQMPPLQGSSAPGRRATASHLSRFSTATDNLHLRPKW